MTAPDHNAARWGVGVPHGHEATNQTAPDQPDFRQQLADAIPTALTATPHVGIGSARRLKIAEAMMPVVQARLDAKDVEIAEAKADAERGWKDAQERQDDAQAWAQTASQCLQMTHATELRMQRISGWLSGLIEQEMVSFGDEGVPIDTDTMEVVIKGVERIIQGKSPTE